MFVFVLSVHVVVCILLILIVLVQQGKGGGLIDSFSSAESVLGTKTSTFLVKSTTTLSVLFFLTCLSLAFLSIQRNKSLVDTTPASSVAEEAVVQADQAAATEAPKAAEAPDEKEKTVAQDVGATQ